MELQNKIKKLASLGLINNLANKIKKTLIESYITRAYFIFQKLLKQSLLVDIIIIH